MAPPVPAGAVDLGGAIAGAAYGVVPARPGNPAAAKPAPAYASPAPSYASPASASPSAAPQPAVAPGLPGREGYYATITPPAPVPPPAPAPAPAVPVQAPVASTPAAPVASAPVPAAPAPAGYAETPEAREPIPSQLPLPTGASAPPPRVAAPVLTQRPAAMPAYAPPAPVQPAYAAPQSRPAPAWTTVVAPPPPTPVAEVRVPPVVPTPNEASGAAPTPSMPYPAAMSPGAGANRGAIAPGSWDVLRAGDSLEIRFYRNNARQTDRYLIQPGDILRIDVVDHPDVSLPTITVLPDGYLSAPLIGSVEAAGKTVDDVRAALVGRYEAAKLLNPDVSVAVVSADQRIESLLRPEPGGGSPGMRVTVSTTGYLDLPFVPQIPADRTIAEVQRDIKAAYRRVFGDRLEVNANLVEHTVPVIYVAGQVIKPTEVPLVAPLTPISAIGAAGGFLPIAAPDNVHVIRFQPDGSYQDFKFKLDDDLKKSEPTALTFQLHPQDVVFVPKSGVAKANDFVEQYIRNMLPIPISGGFTF